MHRASPRVPAPRPYRLLAAVLLLLAGCGGAPDPRKEIDSISSWTATMQLARLDRQHQRTTRLHAVELRDLARKAMEDSRQSLAGQPLSGADRRKAGAALDSLHAAIGDMDHELDLP